MVFASFWLRRAKSIPRQISKSMGFTVCNEGISKAQQMV